MNNKYIVLGDFSENFEEDKMNILAAAEKLFASGIILPDKEEEPFSLYRTICDGTKWNYPVKDEYAPVGITNVDGKVSVSAEGQFSTEIPKTKLKTEAIEAR